jgi:hypothetical protein
VPQSTPQPEGAARPRIPQAACDRTIPAAECLTWHIAGAIPSARMNPSGRSCRLLCPNHADLRPSLTISTGDGAALIWHCHACGKERGLEVRAALIRVYNLNPKCLPMTRQERAEMEAMMDAVFASSLTPCSKLVCLRALRDGMRGPLPKAPALAALGERAGVSRRAAFRAAEEMAGTSLDHLFVPKHGGSVNDPKVAPAFRQPASVPDWHSVPDGHSGQRQIGTDGNEAA